MWKIILVAVILSFAVSAVLVATNGCNPVTALDETKELEAVEIREYQGESLSSVNDFRENSIIVSQMMVPLVSMVTVCVWMTR